MPRKEATTSAVSSAQAQQESASEGVDTYELPKSLVTRIARSAFPENVKLQKEAVLALLKGSTVFINYIAATAHDVAASKQHKSVSASDVLRALELTQFGDMVDKLQDELQAYRDLQKTDKPSKKAGPKGKAKDIDGPSSASSAKGKQRATVIVSDHRSASAHQPPPSSEPEPDDGEETEDDAQIIRAPHEGGDGEGPEGDDEEDEEVDEEDEVDDDAEEEDENMEVEGRDASEEAQELEGRTLEHQDEDTEMDS